MLGLIGACGLPEVSDPPLELSSTPPGRFALGMPADYPALPLDESGVLRLRNSAAEARAFAWSVIARSVASTEVDRVDGAHFVIPRFMTWYASDDIDRQFIKAFSALTPEQRRAHAPIDHRGWEEAALADIEAVRQFEHWPEERLLEWVRERAQSLPSALSFTGLSRTLYNKEAASHLIRQYQTVMNCRQIARESDADDDTVFAPCFPEEFPPGAVIVKTSWRRAGFGIKVGVHDSSAVRLQAAFERAEWGDPDRELEVDPSRILTLRLTDSAQYQLTGLHVMSKEAREWVWATLWWSDDPDTDFGADRPEDMPDPWGQYKMCAVVGFEEPVVDDVTESAHPDLAAALRVVHQSFGGESWCSSPHFEDGVSNQRSNCIGCHQYGGLELTPEEMLADQSTFGDGVRPRRRQNFPADYLWSLTKTPENISHRIAERARQLRHLHGQRDQ